MATRRAVPVHHVCRWTNSPWRGESVRWRTGPAKNRRQLRKNSAPRGHLSACCPQWGSYWRRYFVWHVLVESANSGQGPDAGAQAFATRGVIQAFHQNSLKGLCRFACSPGGESRGNYAAGRLYALVSMMRVISSTPIVESANHVVRLIADSYVSPNKTLRELHQMVDSDSIDALRAFSEACRAELQRFQMGALSFGSKLRSTRSAARGHPATPRKRPPRITRT